MYTYIHIDTYAWSWSLFLSFIFYSHSFGNLSIAIFFPGLVRKGDVLDVLVEERCMFLALKRNSHGH